MKISKTIKGVSLLALGVALVSVVALSAVRFADGLGDSGKVSTKCDSGQRYHYDLEIKDNSFSPAFIKANRCDTMTIKNLDDRSRLVAFGKHDKHISYDGISERYLLKGESFTVTLDKTGTFLVHDHNQEEVQANFTVEQ